MNLDADVGLAILVNDLEGEVLDVVLDRLVLELLADETFLLYCQYTIHYSSSGVSRATYDIEDGSVGVGRELVLGGVTDKAFLICEGYPRRSDTVTCRGYLSVCLSEDESMPRTYPGRWR